MSADHEPCAGALPWGLGHAFEPGSFNGDPGPSSVDDEAVADLLSGPPPHDDRPSPSDLTFDELGCVDLTTAIGALTGALFALAVPLGVVVVLLGLAWLLVRPTRGEWHSGDPYEDRDTADGGRT